MTVPIPAGVRLKQADGILNIERDGDQFAALHGLTRALAANAIQGVSTGFVRELDIVGTGYRADVKGKIATFVLGYSHPIEVLLPDAFSQVLDWLARNELRDQIAALEAAAGRITPAEPTEPAAGAINSPVR